MNLPKNWVVEKNPQAVAESACKIIIKAAQEAIAKDKAFKIVLAGGKTPETIYQLLSKAQSDWMLWHIYLGDERCYPIDHPQRNSNMIKHNFLRKVPIPDDQIHFIPAEFGPEQGASMYNKQIKSAVPFDMVLLGMGEDGHTASLFPSQILSIDTDYVKAVYDAPKPPLERISLTMKALNNCKNMIVVVTGSTKKMAIKKWLNGGDLPVANVSAQKEYIVVLDRDVF